MLIKDKVSVESSFSPFAYVFLITLVSFKLTKQVVFFGVMESLPHDVVELILERLAVKPLMRFKCVSRQWKSTIESEYFKQRLLKQDPSALLQVVVVPTHEIDTRERVDEARRCTKQENIMIFVFLLIWSLVLFHPVYQSFFHA